jgi:hypothetical protein
MGNAVGRDNIDGMISVADFISSFINIGKIFSSNALSCISVVKDEVYFIRAFLEHYRAIGVQQFVFWDDKSSDGTREYLQCQDDCVVLVSPCSYGDLVRVTEASFNRPFSRAGILFRSLMAKTLDIRDWIVIADVDEFLFLPPSLPSLRLLFDRLTVSEQLVRSALVEFYPKTLWPGDEAVVPPPNLAALIECYGHFDARPVLSLSKTGAPKLINDTVAMRMFRQLGIAQEWRGAWPPDKLWRWMTRYPPRTPFVKTPLVRWSSEMSLNGNHPKAGRSPRDLVLASAHFKFTPDLDRRTRLALATRAYAGKSAAYVGFDDLISKMRERGKLSFLNAQSRQFHNVEELVSTGIMTVGERFKSGQFVPA